jgi:hypothetical protein
VRITCQDGLAEREENERSGGSVWMPARQKSREVEGQVWVQYCNLLISYFFFSQSDNL